MRVLVYPVFQPIYDLKTEQPAWYEALARLTGDSSCSGHGPLLKLGEQYGFVSHIDQAMLHHVAAALVELHLPVAVNVSTKTVEHHQDEIFAFLSQRPGIGKHLVWEITETRTPLDVTGLINFAVSVKRFGSKLAVDDFGSGYWDESFVALLEPDLIKTAWGNAGMIEAIRLARKYGAEVVVECIEDEESLETLKQLPVRYAQGFHLGRPMPLGFHLGTGTEVVQCA